MPLQSSLLSVLFLLEPVFGKELLWNRGLEVVDQDLGIVTIYFLLKSKFLNSDAT